MVMTNHVRNNLNQYPDMKLYQEIIFLKYFFKGKYIVENVNPYYKPLIEAQKIQRHLIWSNFNIPNIPAGGMKNFIDAKYEDLEKYLGIYIKKKIYIGNSHDPGQILRNCIHPELGKYIFDRARNIQIEENIKPGKLF